MKNQSKYAVFFMVMVVAITGCVSSTDGDDGQLKSLKGTQWKLAGIVYTKTGELKTLEPNNCDDCYTLTFITNTTAEMFLEEYARYRERIELKLSLLGEYMIDYRGRPNEGYILVQSLFSHNTKSYSISSSELKFLNDIDKYYLLFNRIEQ